MSRGKQCFPLYGLSPMSITFLDSNVNFQPSKTSVAVKIDEFFSGRGFYMLLPPQMMKYSVAFLFSAPANMSLSTTSYSTVSVLFTANSDAHRIAHYDSYIAHLDNSPTCRIPASYHELECDFFLLTELTEYTFVGSACLSDDRCSLVLEGKVKTWEKRKCFCVTSLSVFHLHQSD